MLLFLMVLPLRGDPLIKYLSVASTKVTLSTQPNPHHWWNFYCCCCSPHLTFVVSRILIFKFLSGFLFIIFSNLLIWLTELLTFYFCLPNKTCSTSINDTTLDNTIKWGDRFIFEDHKESDSCIITKYRTSL